jgi:hypothetical protein
VRERKRETGGRLTNLPPVSSKNNKNKGNDELKLFWVIKIFEKKRKRICFQKPFPNLYPSNACPGGTIFVDFFCVTHCTSFLDSVVETHFLCQTVSRSSIRAELGGYVTVLDDTELEDEFGS